VNFPFSGDVPKSQGVHQTGSTPNAPVAEVFDYVGDQRVYTKWCPGVAMCEMTSTGEVGVGATRNV